MIALSIPDFRLPIIMEDVYKAIDNFLYSIAPLLYLMIGVALVTLVIKGIMHIIAIIRGDI
jgi:hypothetical protein